MTSMPSLDLSNRPDMTASRDRVMRAPTNDAGSIGRLAVRLNQRLSRAPRVCVLGELNSGKSTLVNVLLGNAVLPTSATANTRMPIRIFRSNRPCLSIETGDHERVEISSEQLTPELLAGAVMLHAGLPLDRLESFEMVDTPGLQSGDDSLCERAMDACRQSHLAIWCSTATQAWKASELGVWQSLPKRLRNNGILAVTFKDAIGSREDEGRLWGRINAEAAPHFKTVVMISARDAIAARRDRDRKAGEYSWHASGAAELVEAVDRHVSSLIMERVRGAERLLNTALSGTPYQAISA